MKGRKGSSGVLRLLLIALVVQIVGILLWFSSSQATNQQPVAFNHEAMVEGAPSTLLLSFNHLA